MSEWTHECKCADACDFARQSEWVRKRLCVECPPSVCESE
jgi:hypothetical protein